MKCSYEKVPSVVKFENFWSSLPWCFWLIGKIIQICRFGAVWLKEFFDQFKNIIWEIVQHNSCRKLNKDATVKFWKILVKLFGTYGQNTSSLDKLFSGSISLQTLKVFTLLSTDVDLGFTRESDPHYLRHPL